LKNFIQYFVGVVGAIFMFPLILLYFMISLFWKIFGATVIAFLILIAFNATMEQCFKYAPPIGLFVGVFMKLRETIKK